jgi:hypothetical protein
MDNQSYPSNVRKPMPDCIAMSTPRTDVELTALDRAHAAWLWSGRRAILVGHSASALLGSRWLPLETAAIRIDALLNATKASISQVESLAIRYPGARGIRQLRTALDLADTRAEYLGVAAHQVTPGKPAIG